MFRLLLVTASLVLLTWSGVHLHHKHTVAMAESELLRAQNERLRYKAREAVMAANEVIQLYKKQDKRCREQYL